MTFGEFLWWLNYGLGPEFLICGTFLVTYFVLWLRDRMRK